MIVIKAKKDGFRRCGVAHSAHATAYPDGRWTAEELAILKAEPRLEVREIEDEAAVATTPCLEKMTVGQLKILLGKLSVEHPADARKAELIELVKAHTGEPAAREA